MGTFLVDLNSFQVVKKSDVLKEEPYLWLLGIAIDQTAGASQDPTRFILKRPSRPGNLGGPFKKGESRAIPDGTGRIEKTVVPIFGKLALGFIVMAWDHDNTPPHAVEAAYDDAAQILNTFVQGRVSALNTGPLTNAELAKIKADIEAHIRDRFRATVALRHPGTLNQDDFVDLDFRFITPDPAAAVSENLDLRMEKPGVEYRVTGVLRYTP